VLIDSIKNKSDNKEIDKIYTFDKLATTIIFNSNEVTKFKKIFEETKLASSNNDANSEISLTPSLQSQESGRTYKETILKQEQKIKNPIYLPSKSSNDTILFGNENCFVIVRYIFCIYERLNKVIIKLIKLYEYSITGDNNLNNLMFKNFIVIYKALIHKKIDNTTFYEDLCRDVLGNESYFLFNLDKLVNSLIKTLNTMSSDNVTKEILDLFIVERSRSKAMSEEIYLSNYIQMVNECNITNFRILYSVEDRVMSIHLIDIPFDHTRNDYLDSFKEFIDNIMQESYSKLIEENDSLDEPFTIYLKRNVNLMKKRRMNISPFVNENNFNLKVRLCLYSSIMLVRNCII
jgi:paired amphipathic helix protein Sin3a